MRSSLNKLLKILSIAVLSLLLLCSLCFGALTLTSKQGTADVSDAETAVSDTQKIADQYIQNFNFDRVQTPSNVAANSPQTLPAGLTLTDFDVNTDTNYYVVVAFVNLSGNSTKWADADVNNIMRALNDDTPNNDIFSVREYFKEQSYGKINFQAGYTIQDVSTRYNDIQEELITSAHYETEQNIFAEAVNKAGEIKHNGNKITNFHCRLIHYPYKSDDRNYILWPHSWSSGTLVSSPKVIVNGSHEDEAPFTGTYAHEFSHALGLPDLYCDASNSEVPVGSWFIMASTNYFYPQSLNAFFKGKLGFTTEAPYGFNNDAKIRTVTSSGDYELSPCNSQDGVIAYKFAEREITMGAHQNQNGANCSSTEKAKEMFFVEYKVKASSKTQTDYGIDGTGLIIYRVVTSVCTDEIGNLYPDRLGEVKYQVYILRDKTVSNTQGAAIITNGLFGSNAENSKSNKVITYHDGTNTRIVIQNKGTDSNGNAIVNFRFPEESERFTVSGTFKVDGVAKTGVRLYTREVSSAGGRSAAQDAGVSTDASGHFFINDLKDGTEILFAKNETEFYQEKVTVNGENQIDIVVSETSNFEFTFKLVYMDNNDYKPLQGVKVRKKGETTILATTNNEGIAVVTLQLNDQVEFELEGYNINIYTFTNPAETEQQLVGQNMSTSQNVQLKVVDAGGAMIEDVEILDMTGDEGGSLSLPVSIVEGNYAFSGIIGHTIMVKAGTNYAPVTFKIEQTDTINVRTITLYSYQSTTVTIKNALNEYIADVEVYVDDTLVGRTTSGGQCVIEKVAKNQTITFKHSGVSVDYSINPFTYGGEPAISLQANYAKVDVLLEFYRPNSFDTGNLLSASLFTDGSLTVSVNGAIVSTATYGEKLRVPATYMTGITFSIGNYVITDENGNKLSSADGISLIVTKDNAVAFEDGSVTYRLFAKKIVTLTGVVEFPDGADSKSVDIYINGLRVGVTDENGAFLLKEVVEGDEIVFKCEGYEFGKYYVVDTTEPLKIAAEQEDPFKYLSIYILFGVLAICFIAPYFVGLSRKKKYLEDIDNMGVDTTDTNDKKSKKNKKK